MNKQGILRSALFAALLLLFTTLRSQPGLSQSFDFKSIKSIGPTEAAQSNVVIDRIGPAGIVKRLQTENVLPEVNLSKKISEAKDRPVAEVLRDLVTASSKVAFKSGLNGTFGVDLTALTTDAKADLFGTTPSIEASSVFMNNVASLVDKAAGEPGFLRIWRGQKVMKPDVYPDAVLVSGNGAICTGTLVGPQHVVTAAHCFCDGVNHEVSIGTSLLDVIVRAEVDVQNSRSHIDCEQMKPANVLVNVGKGDIALLKLKTPLSGIKLRRIATEPFLQAAAAVRAVGFGRSENEMIGTKFVVDIVVASYDCTGATVAGGGKYGCTPGTEMIAAGLNRDTCNGDSGGPIYILGPDINLYLAAVTSRSVDPNGVCGKGGIYAKLTVPAVKQWLLDGGVPETAFAQ